MRGKRRKNNKNHLHKQHSENLHRKYRKRQPSAFASPGGQRGTSDSAGRFHGVFPRTVLPNTSKRQRANHVRPYSMHGKRHKNNKNRLYKQHIECHITSTGKGNYRRLQAQADSEERAIPPNGFTEFSLGQCCRIRQSVIGRTMFAPTMSLSRSHGSMWASTPTDLPFQENKTTPLPYRASPLKEETFCLANAELLRQPSAQESTIGVCSPRRTARATSDSAAACSPLSLTPR